MFLCAAQKAPSVKCTLTVILALLCNCMSREVVIFAMNVPFFTFSAFLLAYC